MKQSISQKNEIKLNVMGEQIKNIQGDVTEIKTSLSELTKKIDDTYVTKKEFDPVKKIAFGLVGLISVGVVGALLSLVVKQ